MGDVLQLIDLDDNCQPSVVLDLNALVADRGYYLERDTLQLSPGARDARFSQVAGRYGGQRQVGEARGNATLSATFAVKGAAYGSVQSDIVMADAEALLRQMDAPDMVAGARYLMFRPEFASGRRRTLFRPMGAADWRPRYIRNAFTGGNVMGLELTVPIAPKSFGMPLDNTEPLDDAARFADQWSKYGGGVAFTVDGNLYMAGGDTANRVLALQDRRGEPVSDREILVGLQWDGGDDAVARGLGVVVKGTDADNYLALFLRNRAATFSDQIWWASEIGGVDTTGLSAVGTGVDLPTNTKFWLRVRVVASTVYVDVFNQTAQPNPSTTPTASGTIALSTIGAGHVAAFGAAATGWGGVLLERATSSNWKVTDYVDRPFTFRNMLSTDTSTLYRVPGTVDADAEVEVYHRSGNRPRYGLLAWKRKGTGPETPAAFGVVDSGSLAGDGSAAGSLGATFLGGNGYLFTAAAAGASGLRAYYDARFDAYAADAFAGPVIPVAVFARVSIPSTLVTPRLAAWLESAPGVLASRSYAVDTTAVGRLVPVPSSGVALRFLPVGIVLVDTRVAGTQRVGIDLSYGPGSSGAFHYDYLLLAPARQLASSPTGKESASYPDVFAVANTVKRFATDLSARARAVSEDNTLLRLGGGLGGARIELAVGRNDFIFKGSDLIPDDPAASAASEELNPSFDVRFMVTPCYRLWGDA